MVDVVRTALNSCLFFQDPETDLFQTNFDRSILELIDESKHMARMGLELPTFARQLIHKEPELKKTYNGVNNLLTHYRIIIKNTPPIIEPLMTGYRLRLFDEMLPGIKIHTWMSLNSNVFISNVESQLSHFELVTRRASEILENRIENTFQKIRSTDICFIPEEEPVSIQEFINMTQQVVNASRKTLASASQFIEVSINELFHMLKKELLPDELINMEAPYYLCRNPLGKYKVKRCKECLPCHFWDTLTLFGAKNLDVLSRCVAENIKYIRKCVYDAQLHHGRNASLPPVFLTDVVLEIPNIVCKPGLDEIQSAINQAGQILIGIGTDFPNWNHDHTRIEMEKKDALIISEMNPMEDSPNLKTTMTVKSIFKVLHDNKDIAKAAYKLNSLIPEIESDICSWLEQFQSYNHLWNNDPVKCASDAADQSKDLLYDFSLKIREFSFLEKTIENIPSEHRVGPLLLRLEPLKLGLLQDCNTWKQEFARTITAHINVKMNEISNFLTATKKNLSKKVKSLDSIRTVMTALVDVRDKQLDMEVDVKKVEEAYFLFNRHGVICEQGTQEKVDSLGYAMRNILSDAAKKQDILLEIQPSFKTGLLTAINTFQVDFDIFLEKYTEKGPTTPGISPTEAYESLSFYQLQFDELWASYETCSGGELLFGLPVTSYPELHRVKKELVLLWKLYTLYNSVLVSIAKYNETTWTEIDIIKISEDLQEFQKKCKRLPRALKDYPAFTELKKCVDDLTETCPLIEMMTNKAMKERHWSRINKVTGADINILNDFLTLKDVMEVSLLHHKEDIEDICIAALKELDIEAKLKAMKTTWEMQIFKFGQFKNRGELLLKGDSVIELIALMEDSMMILSTLMSNRYNLPFKAELQKYIAKLSQSNDIVEMLLQVQNIWVYLEAVFVGGDIAKQLPEEAKRFALIDKSWQKIMTKAHETPNVLLCCTGDEILSEMLPHLLELLEICQKSLTGYLEKKRLLFPRFFFVSDTALLEILGQASDSHTIQSHLLSIFDNVAHVTFCSKQYDKITDVLSAEGDKLELHKPTIAAGNVEYWLNDLLQSQRASLHSVIKDANDTIGDEEFELLEFSTSYISQVVLLAIQMIWTRDSEVALQRAAFDKKIMHSTNKSWLEMLNTLIKVTTQDLAKFERLKYETLITIHIHQTDIFDDLCRLRVRSKNDFEWLKQTRIYFKEDVDACFVHITDIKFGYMYEFIGCRERLVITPLTDRCYITVAQALGLALGAAPAGPAGTGKTETTKDMGRTLGAYVVVFNCSEQMDFRGLGRIFKGLAQSGSWGCFDEFNRINLNVLSVAAQQIAIVLQCKRERKSEFIFTDGDNVSLHPSFGLFITMNPGYAGRQELPENLKINFRTVAMMVPDRLIIIRVKLAITGFQANIILSRKFYTLYKLCEEQLSKQVHYDFGLRNILSVLRTLGGVKRQNPNEPEPKVVMRVLRDMNLSKLIDEDEPLFLSLINDCFPGIALDKAVYRELEAALSRTIKESSLIDHKPWVLKCIQLYETQLVRWGIMTLGPSGAGKTEIIHTLMGAMTICDLPHKELRMNPKAVTASQMFGQLDVATNDWTDGIFSTLWRRTHKLKKSDNVWLVLDGPVDAIWIENLNSVLDDNRTLTLANGDRIPMAPNCKIIFEPQNIDNASPATVSRNGIVFLSSSVITWEPLVLAWTERKPSMKTTILNLYQQYFPEMYQYLVEYLNPKIELLECMYVRQSLDILDGMLPSDNDNMAYPGHHHNSKVELPDNGVERLFTFSLMWSLGAALELSDRVKFQEKLRDIGSLDLPLERDTIFDYAIDCDNLEWCHWSERVPEYLYPKDCTPNYLSILVPNVDNVRTEFLIHIIHKQNKRVLLIGEQGTAKTVMIKTFLSKFDSEFHINNNLNFSSATTPLMYQRTIESFVEKHVGHTYGPRAGKKMTVFIDDINMPVINEWGDQVTNEIVRQLLDVSGFYNLDKPGDFTTIVDVQFLAAMIHPGGGRNNIPERLRRQFNVFNCTLPSNNSIDKIYNTIGCGHFITERGFCTEVVECVSQLVSLTRLIWQCTKIKMLPIPGKFHYVFNLRDLSRIWQGMLNSTADVINSRSRLFELWRHEIERVVADRFVNQVDKQWFNATVRDLLQSELKIECNDFLKEDSYFVDFLREAPEPTGDEVDDDDLMAPKVYEPIPGFDKLKSKLLEHMAECNEESRGGEMDLVFFDDAMIHLMRISRIIRTWKGHALLVGVGGCGKQSLTKLASFIAGYSTYRITLTRSYNVADFLTDLKVMYRITGEQGKGLTFIFTDNDIKDEMFLEPMNNVLASGEVSNLFAKDEMDEICSNLIPIMKKEFPRHPPTQENLIDYFYSRVGKNFHVTLCFSSAGNQFQSRALKFPALISGCTIDWFQIWPRDALTAVSVQYSRDLDFQNYQHIKNYLVEAMADVHVEVTEMCSSYFERFRRQTHVTPKSYLSFLNGYNSIYVERSATLKNSYQKMDTGLLKLDEATVSVNELQKELVVTEVELDKATVEADLVLKEVAEFAHAAEKVKLQVESVKNIAQDLVDLIESDKAIAEEKLEVARPALEEAEMALQTIKAVDIATVRKLGKPPHLIMRILDCVLILFQKPLDPCSPDLEKTCPKASWGESLKVMGDSKFLSNLLNFDKDCINDEIVELMEPYLKMADYNMETAKKVSGNVAGLLAWTIAMSKFFSVNREVLPLKASLAAQEHRLVSANNELEKAQVALNEKEEELMKVQVRYDTVMGFKQNLVDRLDACRFKMESASKLIQGLGGERIRWTESSRLFKEQLFKLMGDALLITGFLSYAGPFNQLFRQKLITRTRQIIGDRSIPYSQSIDINDMLVDKVTVSRWNLQGLPSDELSIQNGVIVTNSSRYPLVIDPQIQAKYWIKNKESENNMIVTQLDNKYFRTHLEDAISLGQPLLLEDVRDELDPCLDNVLEKIYFKSGSTFKVTVGDKEIDISKGFRLYITTKLSNPNYTPEISSRTSIIDFTVTMKGLEDQLLGLVTKNEKSELESESTRLADEVTANKEKLQELEENLLQKLSSVEGSLVEDQSLIEVLGVTKAVSNEVKEKLTIAAQTELQINAAREEYRPIANRGSILYFLIVEISLVNEMYQTSLKQFLNLFHNSMVQSVKSPITSRRVHNIMEYLTFEVFRYTARGLYEMHKFMFTILLALKIDINLKNIRYEEFQTFIMGGAMLDLISAPTKPKRWITDTTWLNLVQLSKLPLFHNILEQVNQNEKSWKSWFESEAPEAVTIPDGYDNLSTFNKLLLIRCWCPDRILSQARMYVASSLGEEFTAPVVTNLEEMWKKESDCRSPLICFLSMGSDPTSNIEKLAKYNNIICKDISMGQGQEVHARRILKEMMRNGGWCLFQNCHLDLNFMSELLELITTTEQIDPAMRVWITTEPHVLFPISLLQASIKFTNDPPLGLKAGLKRTYAEVTKEQLDISHRMEWKPLMYAVAFLHSVVQERRKFGPLGWNIPYEFNQADFSATVMVCQNHLDDLDTKRGVSWVTIRYMIGEVHYGGRVTDDFDKRLLNTFARVWFGENLFDRKFNFYIGYTIPRDSELEEIRNHIDKLPLIDTPQAFGLHPNADITYQTNFANDCLATILNIQPKESNASSGESRETQVLRMASEMEEKLPPDYNPFKVKERLKSYGVTQPLNIFLRQELHRMQRVITSVRTTLHDLKLAIEGSIIMNEILQDALDNMFNARVPDTWAKVSWLSSTLGFWFTELLDRNAQMRSWILEGRPNCFWMTGMFNPQGFLTAMRQETTRSHTGWALDDVVLANEVTRMMREEVSHSPVEGVFVYGLFLDGGGWNRKSSKLTESTMKVLFTPLPVVRIYADLQTGASNSKERLYECPVYKKPSRTDLNYICSLSLHTDQHPDFWILRGVALLCDFK